MGFVVQSNIAAMKSLHKLGENSKSRDKSLKKLSMGAKITGAADDASGFSIGKKMQVRVRALEQDLRNCQNGISMIKTASGAIDSTVDILRTMKEKALNAANDTNTDVDRGIIQKEIDQLIEQIDDNAAVTYNDKYLLMGNSGLTVKKIDFGEVTGAIEDLSEPEQTSLKSFMSSLVTTGNKDDGLDVAIKEASGGKFETLDDLTASFLADFQANVGAANSTESQNFLKDYCGIVLYNADTGAITGSDAGGPEEKTNVSIVPEDGPTSAWELPTPGSSTTIKGLTFKWPSNVYAADSPEGIILRGLNGEWMESCLNLIEESYGIGFDIGNPAVNEISIEFENDADNGRLAAVSHSYYPSTGEAASLKLIINMNYYNAIDPDDVNGYTPTSGAGYLDRTLAHEFTHAAMAANINYFGSMPAFIKEGTAELVHGIDDFRLYGPNGFRSIVSTDGYDKLKTLFEAKASKTSGVAGIDSELHYTGGYMLLRYLAKQSSLPSTDSTKDSAETTDTSSTDTDDVDDTKDTDSADTSTTDENGYIKEDEVFDFSDKKFVHQLDLQLGDKANMTTTVRLRDMTARSLGLRENGANTFQVTTRQKAVDSLRVADRALAYALGEQTTLGAIMNRLEYTADNIAQNIGSTMSSESTITDADMAKEMAEYTKYNVLSQVAQSMLSQANQNASGVLSLLQ